MTFSARVSKRDSHPVAVASVSLFLVSPCTVPTSVEPSPKRRSKASELYRYSGVGLQFAATIGVFAFGGYWLDGKLGSEPWLLIVGVLLGFVLGLYSMTKKVLPKRPA